MAAPPCPPPHGHSSPRRNSSAPPIFPKANRGSADPHFLQGSTHTEEPLLSAWVKPGMVPFSRISNPFEGAVWHFTHLPRWRRELTGLLKGPISTFNTRGEFRQPWMLEIKLSAVEPAGLLARHRLDVCCILTHVPPSTAPFPNPAAPLLSQEHLRASPLQKPSPLCHPSAPTPSECFYLRQNTLRSPGLS